MYKIHKELQQMLVNETYEERNVNSVTENQKKEVKEFLACLVRIWCLTTPEKSFTCAELLKVNNADWKEEPLRYMYDYYIEIGKNEKQSKKLDSQDIGWILKETILEMPQKFETDSSYRKIYTYIPE